MGNVEDFKEWMNRLKPPENEEEAKKERSRIWNMHLSQAMGLFDAPVAQLILLGVKRDLVMEMVNACYTYWVSRTNFEELTRNGAPDDGPGPEGGPDRAG